jgi:two-component system chemotaxis response regulator CheY
VEIAVAVGGLLSISILLVDDSIHMRRLYRTLLSAFGVDKMFEAGDGAEGIDILCQKNPDLVITDWMMAPMDGLQFTRAVRHSPSVPNRYVPILMVSGSAEAHRVLAARDAGVTEFLAKPVTPANLFRRLASIIDNPRPFVRGDQYFGPDRRRSRCVSSLENRRQSDNPSSGSVRIFV